jgi:histidinol-phosphate aminotransferase
MTVIRPRSGPLKIKAPMVAAFSGGDGRATINIFNNESALGPSPKAVAAAKDALNIAERYPEGAPEQLADAIAARFDLDATRIACGHGSDDILARLARAYLSPGDQLIYSVNGYQKIPNYAYANDAEPVAAADDDFKADVDSILGSVTDRTRIVMVASPDNPSGRHLSRSEIRHLHAQLSEEILLVLDSAYSEYVDAPDYEDPTILVEEAQNVVVTRTFSKIFGLAGLRMGWLYGSPEAVDVVKRIGITFPLTQPGLAAGVAALADTEHTRTIYETNRKLRRRFTAELTELGLNVCPSQTNFVLVRFEDEAKPAIDAYEYLAAHGIIARRLAAPVFKNCIRFTIGLDDEMRQAADVLREYMTG